MKKVTPVPPAPKVPYAKTVLADLKAKYTAKNAPLWEKAVAA